MAAAVDAHDAGHRHEPATLLAASGPWLRSRISAVNRRAPLDATALDQASCSWPAVWAVSETVERPRGPV